MAKASSGRSGGSKASNGSKGTSKPVHTTPNPKGSGWVNTQGGEQVSKHRTKEPAVEKGRSIAKKAETEHTIHKKDGTIGEKNSYGNDPNPPKDKNN